jgi:agmatinase
VLSRRLVRAHGDGAVSHGFLRTRVEITARGWALLESFHDPTVPAELFDRLGLDDARRLEYARAISGFVAAGVLVPPDEVEYLYREGQALVAPFRSAMSRTETSFLGSMGPAAAADFHVVGVPFGQVSSNPGTVSGPRAIREASMAVPAQVELKTTAFRGLWDHSREQFLLAGARVADHGNVNLDPWAAAEDAYGRIHDAAGAVLDGGPGLPIFLGGDHAITEGLIRAVAARRGPLFVIHFDAHADMSETVEGMPHHHGNVMEVVRRLSSVTGVLQIGVRYLSPPWWQTPEKTTSVSVERARSATPEEILRLVPVESACYVTIDIDVLDPSEAPGTAALAPGGLRLVELEPLVRSIATAREIVGADLVEVSPDLDRSNLTAKCALRLLLALMDGVHQRRGGRSPTGAPVERLAER